MDQKSLWFSIFLISVISLSFFVENNIIIEKDILELIEKSEKDKDQTKKEKKLYVASLNPDSKAFGSQTRSNYSSHAFLIPKVIFMEMTTPPPETA